MTEETKKAMQAEIAKIKEKYKAIDQKAKQEERKNATHNKVVIGGFLNSYYKILTDDELKSKMTDEQILAKLKERRMCPDMIIKKETPEQTKPVQEP